MSFQFDEMISAPCRLGILATLVPGEPVSFTEMKARASLSDGNLHVQTRKLADAGYIEINKIKKGKRSVTQFRITELGLERLRLYIMKLQKIIEKDQVARKPAHQVSKTGTHKADARKPGARKPVVRKTDDSAVWV